MFYCIKIEWLSLKEHPLSLLIFLPSPRVSALGTSLLNKKEAAYMMQSVTLSPFKCENNIWSGKVITIGPSTWLVCSWNAVSEEGKKWTFSFFFQKKECMSFYLYLPKYLLNASRIAGKSWKWNDASCWNIPSFRQRYNLT